LKYHGLHLLSPIKTWGIVGILAAIGYFNADPIIQSMWPMIPVAMIQPLLGTDFERLQTHCWPVMIAMAVSAVSL